MLKSYYDLTDKSHLPTGAYVTDPYDTTKLYAEKGETLDTLAQRFSNRRQTKALPAIQPVELAHYITQSLYETSSPSQKQKFFIQRQALPTMQELLSVARTAAVTTTYSALPIDLRKARALACKSCKLHQANSRWSKTATALVKAVIGIEEATESEEERTLGICGMCGCALRNKVKIALIHVLAAIVPEQFDRLFALYGPKAFESCWILKESLNNAAAKQVMIKKISVGSAKGKEHFDTLNAK